MWSPQLSGEQIAKLVDAGVAVVVHGNEPTHPYVDNVMVDEVKAVETSVSYLVERGHRRIGTLAGPESMWTGRLRKQGYLCGLRSHGIPIDEQLIYVTDFELETGYRGMQHLLAYPDPPTAVVAADDLLAIGGLLAALDAGLSVPEDVAIVGFDDIPESTIVRPRLTTVRKSIELLGKAAIDLLLERIDCEHVLPARKCTVEFELVCRESA
jgi:DNA-binding LacI/PurR family transcriptional regulator